MNATVVICPKCQTRCQPPASMSSFRCPACSQTCRVAKTAATPTQPPVSDEFRQPKSKPRSALGDANGSANATDAGTRPGLDKNVVYVIAAAGAMALMLIFLLAVMFSLRSSRPDDATRQATQEAAEVAAEQQRLDAIVFREVDLPEAERRRLYADLSQTKSTTVDAKIPISKKSQTRSFIDGNLSKVLDREIEMQSIMNNVPPEDLREILKEGEAKSW